MSNISITIKYTYSISSVFLCYRQFSAVRLVHILDKKDDIEQFKDIFLFVE